LTRNDARSLTLDEIDDEWESVVQEKKCLFLSLHIHRLIMQNDNFISNFCIKFCSKSIFILYVFASMHFLKRLNAGKIRKGSAIAMLILVKNFFILTNNNNKTFRLTFYSKSTIHLFQIMFQNKNFSHLIDAREHSVTNSIIFSSN
jgi:hypothetical protein